MKAATIPPEIAALIKAAAQFEVVRLISHEPNLEETFLSYYSQGEGEDHVA